MANLDIIEYIRKLSKIVNQVGNRLIFEAALQVRISNNCRYFIRLVELGINFRAFSGDLFSDRATPASCIANIKQDDIFVQCYQVMKDRGFDPTS